MTDKKSDIKALADLMVIGIMFVAGIAIGLGIGHFVDRWFGTGPWGTLVFILMGIAAGFINLFRTISKT
ncbi:MAG: AtpZ/AtpI family protein [Acidobacteria bacterium]|nr:AtpZ/AtpI family protein [Acidobacteriota bacterium]MBI3656864.1 AtpZ/AtpI family protein [Acidobacteriota bacterium]